jgi:hypothetical protein
VERSSLHDKRLIVGRRSLRSALRAPVETTGVAIDERPTRQEERFEQGVADGLGSPLT